MPDPSATDAFAGVASRRSPVYGLSGAVVSGHPSGSLAAHRVLEAGGSVADALIACSAVLCVVIPQATALGGDAFVLVHDATRGRTEALDASGTAPGAATPSRFPHGIAPRGAAAATVPGLVRGWEALHARHGRLPWASLFADAVRAAERHPASRLLASGAALARDALAADPGSSAQWLRDGRPPQPGQPVEQPALADTLRAIAADGADAFYQGAIPASLCAAAARRGGLLTPDDLAGFAVRWTTPLTGRYRDVTVEVMPPPSYGLLLLLQLALLDGLPRARLAAGDVERLELLIRAARASLDHAQGAIADPALAEVPLDALLGPAAVERLRRALAGPPAPARAHATGGTSAIVVADAEGNRASIVQSVFHPFGCAVLDPGTGIALNNRMCGFSTAADSPNVVAPGKRPAHTLNPVLARRDDGLAWALATPGGPSQTLTLTQVLVNLLDRGQDVATAIEGPRWSIDLGGQTLLEDGYPSAVDQALAAGGTAVTRASGALYFGSVKLVERRPDGTLLAFADHRREVFALGA